ncbi:hypothetical protein NFI96_004877 [Prochilodus magdalenae]|nr:hypothetical protein NFI96_004877 [Prochilodus magdalenae]
MRRISVQIVSIGLRCESPILKRCVCSCVLSYVVTECVFCGRVCLLLRLVFCHGPRPSQKEIVSLRAFMLLFLKQLILKVRPAVPSPAYVDNEPVLRREYHENPEH